MTIKLARGLALALPLFAGGAALCQPARPATAAHATPSLPPPSTDPLKIDFARDPVLRLSRTQVSPDFFRATIDAAVERHPSTQEAAALTSEARYVVDEANERRKPSIDMTVTSYKVIARKFSNDPDNVIERSRPAQRTDATLTVQQTIFDFGAGADRVLAAGARLRAAAADAEANADQVALSSIAAWYDVFAYRSLVSLTEAFVRNQEELRAAVEERIRQGVSAPGDTARVDSYLASAETRLALFRRQQANAEARFTELTGAPPPPGLERAPVADLPNLTRDAAALAAMSAPQARAAQAMADSARQEAKATRADRFPQIAVGIDAGRYGVFENNTDYDIRGRVTMRQRLFGGTEARLAQAQARARSADARAPPGRDEAAPGPPIPRAHVQALGEQMGPLETSYIASPRPA